LTFALVVSASVAVVVAVTDVVVVAATDVVKRNKNKKKN